MTHSNVFLEIVTGLLHAKFNACKLLMAQIVGIHAFMTVYSVRFSLLLPLFLAILRKGLFVQHSTRNSFEYAKSSVFPDSKDHISNCSL